MLMAVLITACKIQRIKSKCIKINAMSDDVLVWLGWSKIFLTKYWWRCNMYDVVYYTASKQIRWRNNK